MTLNLFSSHHSSAVEANNFPLSLKEVGEGIGISLIPGFDQFFVESENGSLLVHLSHPFLSLTLSFTQLPGIESAYFRYLTRLRSLGVESEEKSSMNFSRCHESRISSFFHDGGLGY